MPKKGYKQTEEHRKKLSESKKGKPRLDMVGENNPNYGKGLFGEDNGMFGKTHTEETRKKLSEINIGRKQSKETIEKRIKSNTGKKRTEDTKRKISDSHKGKEFSEEHKRKISENHIDVSRENNPNWKGGITEQKYCPKFNNKLKEKIRNRDNHICQLCGKTEEKNNKKLAIHHIHYDKENCYPDLITICNSCNSKVNFNREYYEEYFMKILEERKLLNYFGEVSK